MIRDLPNRFRPTRSEAALLAALLLTTSLLGLASAVSRRHREGQAGPSALRVEEEQVRVRMEASFHPQTLQERVQRDPALKRAVELTLGAALLVLVGTLWALLRAARRLLRGEPAVVRLGRPPPAAWSGRELLRFTAVLALTVQLLVLFGSVLAALLETGRPDLHLTSLGNTLFMDAVVILGAYGFFVRRDRLRQGQAVSSAQPWAGIRLAVEAYLAGLPLLFLLIVAAAFLAQLLGLRPSPQPVFTMYMAESRAPVVTVLLLLATLAGPVAEELFFRGLLYGWLRGRLGVPGGLVISSALFSLLHTDLYTFVPLLCLGLLFGWVYERSGTLWAPIAVHVAHNGGMLAMASVMKAIMTTA